MSGSNVSYNSHGLLYVTCITLFRGSLAESAAHGPSSEKYNAEFERYQQNVGQYSLYDG